MPTPSTRRNANRARCQFAACDKFAQTRGLCKAHGGGSRCRDPSCNKLAQSRGLCIAHGGGRRCQFDGCKKLAQSKGYCISHGGGRRCTMPGCEKFSQVKGRCKSHSKLLQGAVKSPLSPASSPPHAPTASMSPVNTKLSIDFLVNPLLSRSTSAGDKQGASAEAPSPVQAAAFAYAPRAMPALSNPFHSEVLGNQRSLLSFLEPASSAAPRAAFPAFSAPSMVLPAGRFQAPMLPPLSMYR